MQQHERMVCKIGSMTRKTVGCLVGSARLNWFSNEIPRMLNFMKCLLSCSILTLVLAWFANPSAQAATSLRFAAGEKGEFRFDTGVLKGELRADGKSKGFTSVIHTPSGMRVDRNTMGLLSPYRVFTTNHRYGTAAWDWTSEARIQDDGSVAVVWRAEKDRPFELRAKYIVENSNTLAVTFEVKAVEALPGFEVFLASYFDTPFTNAMVWARATNGGAARWVAATPDRGDWQTLPRDDSAAPLFQDGRWKIEPNPVEWRLLEKFAEPKAMRRAGPNGLAALLSADPRDCFAISMPQQAEGHYSLYFSLFGTTVAAGETATAKVRMQITTKPEIRGQ
jgi:hypothetical protein